MKLERYLTNNAISLSEFARQIGVSRQAVWQYTKGRAKPSVATLEKIVNATGGKVRDRDFFDAAPWYSPRRWWKRKEEST